MQRKKPIAVIIGVGPGLGLALTKKFMDEKFQVIIIARNAEHLNSIVQELDPSQTNIIPLAADITKEVDVISAFHHIQEKIGHPEVLIYNASAKFDLKSICDIAPGDFMQAWKSSCFGGLLAAQQVVPHMRLKQKGTIIFTGATASLRGGAKLASFAMAKFSQRALAQSMARELAPQGIHVAHVIIDGFIATPATLKNFPDKPKDTFLDPNEIAQTYWQLHQQDKTAWSHEIDLRPYTEKF